MRIHVALGTNSTSSASLPVDVLVDYVSLTESLNATKHIKEN